uniref:Maturase K n=1 Tax=Campylosiphon championii TaxID=1861789 RepID=A0A2H4EC18_9LILI|nr:maturase K [Burmannia championii]ANK36275.1 maturase K [Burmannia championii]
MDKFREYEYKEKYGSRQFLFPIFFQEYMYALVYDYSLKESLFYELVDMEILDYTNKFSLVLVKQLTIQMYQQNYFFYLVNDFNKNRFIGYNNNFYHYFYSQMIPESFAVIVEILFPWRLGYFFEEKKIPKLKFYNLQSIHSIFPFLEDKLSHLNYVLDILIPHPIHLEILVQTLQRRIQDVPFLHLLRFFLRQYYSWNSSIIFYIFSKEKKKLFQLLYNFYVSESELLVSLFLKKSSYLRSTSYGVFLEQTNFYAKIETLTRVFINFFPHKNVWCFRDPLIHYARYQRKAIIVSKGTRLLILKWGFYLVNFWQYYFQFWSQPDKVERNQLSTRSFFFLGYVSSVLVNRLPIRNQMLKNSYMIEIETKKFDTIVSSVSLIQSLANAKFCTDIGHPISKPIWTNLSDSDIIDKFGQICRNLFHYHSGSSKKQNLYQLKYILRFSCAKTLARKHKSTAHIFLQRSGWKLVAEFFTKEEQVFGSIFTQPLQDLHRLRVWHFDITYMNKLISDS